MGIGGKCHKRNKNAYNTNTRELIFKEDGQEYAIVISLLGNRRCTVKTPDGVERLGTIRGNMRKSTSLVSKNDLILISLREFQDYKADILHVYKQDEVKALIKYDEITNTFINQLEYENTENDILFEEPDIDII